MHVARFSSKTISALDGEKSIFFGTPNNCTNTFDFIFPVTPPLKNVRKRRFRKTLKKMVGLKTSETAYVCSYNERIVNV